MKSDLTCPVEITGVEIRREDENEAAGQVYCLIDFLNLSEKEVSSIQMNIICFDPEETRLGGRLVRAAVRGEGKGAFSGVFVPEHVDGTARVDASVEKVWYADGVVWRREDRNVREYEPNLLPEGRELDRLRSAAGPDARGYAREEEDAWLCVCGRANQSSSETCMRCGRGKSYVLEMYSFEKIDATEGDKERRLSERSIEAVRRSTEQNAVAAERERVRKKKQHGRAAAVIAVLAVIAGGLAAYRWAAPAVLNAYADRQLADGKAATAKQLYETLEAHWPGMTDAAAKIDSTEALLIDRLIAEGSEESLRSAAERAEALRDDQRKLQASLALSDVLSSEGKTEEAEQILRSFAGNEAAETRLCALVYRIGTEAKDQLNYPDAIGRFDSLGAYRDAAAQKKDCVYLYGCQLLREQKYEEACAQLEKVTDYEDAAAQLRTARYRLAAQLNSQGEYQKAAQMFESLGLYEDAAMQATACRCSAGEAALSAGDEAGAAEQFFLAGDYGDAKARFEEIAGNLAEKAMDSSDWETAIGWLSRMERTEETSDKLNRAVYAWAEQLLSEGSLEEARVEFASLGEYSDAGDRANDIGYDIAVREMTDAPGEALTRFEELGNYKDAKQKTEECRRSYAKQLRNAGEYAAALEIYESITGKEAAEEAKSCRYVLAGEAMEKGDYTTAESLYKKCGDYLEAAEGAKKAGYAAAAALEADGAYQKAATAFRALGSYSDAKESAERCEDEWLKDIRTNAKMDTELGNYRGVTEALKGLRRERLPDRYEDLAGMYDDACLGLAQELIGLGRPLEALPYLKEISTNKTAAKRLNDYVYRILGAWKDTDGKFYIFREDGTCTLGDEEGYFGGSGYEISFGTEPYPTEMRYTVVSLRGKVLTLKEKETGDSFRLTYAGTAAEADAERRNAEEQNAAEGA